MLDSRNGVAVLWKMPADATCSSGWLLFFTSLPVCVLLGWLAGKIHTVSVLCFSFASRHATACAYEIFLLTYKSTYIKRALPLSTFMGNIFKLTHTFIVLSMYPRVSLKKITDCIFVSLLHMQINNFDNIEALFKIEGPQNISLIFQAPKTLSVQFCVPVEMPKVTTQAAYSERLLWEGNSKFGQFKA